VSGILPALVGLSTTELLPGERRLLQHLRPAGVLLLPRNVEDFAQLEELCRRVQESLVRPRASALIAADQEGGAVSVLQKAVGCPPSAAALGLADDPRLTERVHRTMAERARRVGVNFLLAPVADVDRPGNPVIGVRSFGDEGLKVSRHVAAAVRGLRRGGVLACAKHWPGHGAAKVDSHLDEVRIDLSAEEWTRIDRAPFAAAAEEGVDALMVGHLSFPALDASGEIAPLSATLLRLAREGLPFSGCLVSDAMEMNAFPPGAAVRALQAGLQLLIFSSPVEEAASELELLDRVEENRLPLAVGPAAASRDRPGKEEDARSEDPSWVEARRRGISAADLSAVGGGEWILLDGASGDRLTPLGALRSKGEDHILPALIDRLGRPPRHVLRWDPHLPFPFTSAQLEELLATATAVGVVHLGLRPLPEALHFHLTVLGPRLVSWSLSLGLEPLILARGGWPRLWIPGLSPGDLELVGEILGRRR